MKKKRNKKFSKRSKILKKKSKIKKRNKLRETKKRNLKRKKRRLRKINRIASRIKLEKIKFPKFNKQIKQFKKISFIKMAEFTFKLFDKAVMETADFIAKPLKSLNLNSLAISTAASRLVFNAVSSISLPLVALAELISMESIASV